MDEIYTVPVSERYKLSGQENEFALMKVRNELLASALRFYANRENYLIDMRTAESRNGSVLGKATVMKDRGAIARSALQGMK
jgi:hypothetical protein